MEGILKKSEIASQFIAQHLNQFQCPVCGAEMVSVVDQTIYCDQGHTFDIAKKGTLFLINAPVKTEYTDEMLKYRQQVLTAGFFEPMLTEVYRHIKHGGLVLDAGCGEGTTTKWLASQNRNDHYVGLDISKPAINIAGSGLLNDPQPLFMVGDLAKLPFGDQQVTSIVNILSPANYQEFDRVIQPGGRLIKVIPNSDYLKELRALVYPEGQHATYDNSPVKQHFIEHYGEVAFTSVRQSFHLTPALFRALFEMTPLTWQAADRKAAILEEGLTEITADFEVGVVNF
ncbi:SAM-dependent methyltransferase [Secundilactobacillus odoratitofui DSM 19909 = JCM 15043]|uniref:SAM-dependent methyltransferase n=1 Tax=Secundilactobacillus odoratitofui DSM 19909 = JCM 15043 TaxID=1423776 RepID=A0A0R1LNN3_9LACO|nr:SAM-dependent methyltransferase [Secundilactobacillus odoratitofui DSM 19909 = JCM 15043]